MFKITIMQLSDKDIKLALTRYVEIGLNIGFHK